jgi:hypothetical protein
MAIYLEAHPKATEESFPARNLGADPNRACVLPALLRTQRVCAIFFLRLPSSLVRIAGHPTRPLSDVAPSYSRFLSHVLIGFSLGLRRHWKEIFCLVSSNSSTQRPFGTHPTSPYPLQTALLMFSWTYGHSCRTKRARSLFSVGCASLKLKYRGGMCSAPAPASLHPYLVSSRLCETRRSATILGCVLFPSNSQEPLNETL